MKKGFTLIELLAVIVILAIIALIATPIILNIINDSKVEANKRSADNYLDAVELAIARENLNSEFNPSACIVNDGELTCSGKVLEVEVDGTTPSEGWFSITDGKIDKYSLSVGEETVANTTEPQTNYIVDIYYTQYISIFKKPPIEDNNITLSYGGGNIFKIELPSAGYSFDWNFTGSGSVKFFSNLGVEETLVSGGTSGQTGTYETSESGYILFSSNGGVLNIKNLKYNGHSVTYNYIFPTSDLPTVSTGCVYSQGNYTCQSNIENGATVSESVYVFANYHGSLSGAQIKINDGDWEDMRRFKGDSSVKELTDPGTYKVIIRYVDNTKNNYATPSDEFTFTITE